MLRKMEENKAIDLRFTESDYTKSSKKEIEELIRSGKVIDGVEMLLEEMLSFLAKIPADEYHDYRVFRHKGLREYLINRFLREKWVEELSRSN